MNDTIGQKGDVKDKRRTLIITKENKRKLQEYEKDIKAEELHQLEKNVRNLQYITLLKALPLVFAKEVVKTIIPTSDAKKEILDSEESLDHINSSNLFKDNYKYVTNSLGNNKEPIEKIEDIDSLFLDDSEQVVEDIEHISQETLKEDLKEEYLEPVYQNSNNINSFLNKNYSYDNQNSEKLSYKGIDETSYPKKQVTEEKASPKRYQVDIKKQEQDKIPIKEELDDFLEDSLAAANLDKLTNHKIIDEYDKKLKDIRVDLRKLIFEYNTLLDDASQLYTSKEAEKLLNKLNEIIKKVEELKKKLELPDIDKYDDNYLYTLVSNYMEEFKNEKFADEIKDSELYITISKKLEELDEKKDILKNKVDSRKEHLEMDEEQFADIKEKYFDYQTFNDRLLRLQQEQEQLLNDINKKIAHSTNSYERVVVQVKTMERQSRKLLQLLAMQMTIPGARSAKALAATALTFMYFAKRMMKTTTKTKRYKVVKVTDYQIEIENSISKLDDIVSLLKKSSVQLETLIKEFKNKYQEYFGILPECNQLLVNLEKVKENLKEKEYEIEKIKLEQERNLARNNEKVKLLTKEEEVI